MSWAKFAIERLKQGETVTVRPRGHSMKGKVNDGNLVTVEPCKPEELSVGDIVLVRVKGNDYFHLIKAIIRADF
jgi:SOS-response transcriptional repressor LexA